MCGITGQLNFGQKIERAVIEQMTATLRHRGPDASAIYISPDNYCALGHTRLSIIDLTAGQQPLSNEDGSVWLSYNGECYNFAELRSQLIQAGHCFRSHCDSEVIVHLYEQYGLNFLQHLRGMFALAIWDQNHKQLILARDRMGQKPLFYQNNKNTLTFASECKAILAANPHSACMNTNAIAEYLLYGYLAGPRSAFDNINRLPPASYITFDHKGNTSGPVSYWHIPQERNYQGSYQQASEQVRETLKHAVQIRMVSDVPLGSFLSGGTDSTIITGIMAQASDQPIKTCGIGFEEEQYNELAFSRIAANAFKCDHIEHIIQPQCHDTICQLLEYYDEPFADASALPTFHLCRLTRQRVTVALSGDGGDEAFAGYRRHKAIRLASTIGRSLILSKLIGLGRTIGISANEHHSRLSYITRFLDYAGQPDWQCYTSWLGVFDQDYLKAIAPNLTLPDNCSKLARELFASHKNPSHAALLLDNLHYLPGDLNTKTDIASMAHSLEVRCPFQDHKLIELTSSLPISWLSSGKNGKKILREAFKDILPPSIARRPKMGFALPTGQWFRKELHNMFRDTVLTGSFITSNIINKTAVETLFQQNLNHQKDNGKQLWTLLMLQLWADRWIK